MHALEQRGRSGDKLAGNRATGSFFHVENETRSWNEWYEQKLRHQSCCFSIKTHAGTKKFRWFFVVSCCTPINQVQATVSEQIVQGVSSFSAIMDVHDPRSNQSFCLTCSASQCHFQSEVIWFHKLPYLTAPINTVFCNTVVAVLCDLKIYLQKDI